MATVITYFTRKPQQKNAMDKDKKLSKGIESGKAKGYLLEHILADMLRSAIAWEEQHGIPADYLSLSTFSSSYFPLKNFRESSDTEGEK